MNWGHTRGILAGTVAMTALALGATSARAAEGPSLEIYGFAQLDYIQDFDRVDPDWEDTLRPSRIPVDEDAFGDGGQAYMSIKQSRFGVKSVLPTDRGAVKAVFDFDLFGVGSDAGQTTIRVRNVYGEWSEFLAGQTNSLFMDGSIFPNTIDYWGPNGMVFLRNPQIRWTPISGDNVFAVALENPSNDIDDSQYRQLENFPGAQSDEEYPDLTAQFRLNRSWGHVQIAGILRYLGAEVVQDFDPAPDAGSDVTYEDHDTGWGVDLTGNVNLFERDVLHWGIVYGEGIASYMNDGGVDLAPNLPPGNPGVKVEAVELWGALLYYDHYWSDRWATSVGYSFNEVDNTSGQTVDAYKMGQYASLNLLFYPTKTVMMGIEGLWGKRENNDNLNNDDKRIQVSFKYDFGMTL